MKNQLLLAIRLLSVLLFAAGCSQVEFDPSAEALQRKAVISESFTAGGDYSDKSVDVLVVVDNSSSMEEEQVKMSERLNSFVSSLNGVDWQIGITTTDISGGQFSTNGNLVNLDGASGYILTPKTTNYEEVFKNTITRDETIDCVINGACPSTLEQPLAATILAVNKKDTDNRGFFREGSDLAVIVLSDEDEMSSAPIEATTPAEVKDSLTSNFPEKNITVFGIITPVDDNPCQIEQAGTGGRAGTYVSILAEDTGGVIGSICDDDYSKNLEKIGERVLELMNHVVLGQAPDPETVDVRFRPSMEVKHSIAGNRLNFASPIPAGTQILVTYRQVGWDFDLSDEERREQLGDTKGDDDDDDDDGDDD